MKINLVLYRFADLLLRSWLDSIEKIEQNKSSLDHEKDKPGDT